MKTNEVDLPVSVRSRLAFSDVSLPGLFFRSAGQSNRVECSVYLLFRRCHQWRKSQLGV